MLLEIYVRVVLLKNILYLNQSMYFRPEDYDDCSEDVGVCLSLYSCSPPVACPSHGPSYHPLPQKPRPMPNQRPWWTGQCVAPCRG